MAKKQDELPSLRTDDDPLLFDEFDFDFRIPDLSYIGLFGDLPLFDISLKEIKTTFSNVREKLSSPTRGRRQHVLEWLASKQHKLFLDKICFVLGVTYIWLTAFLMGSKI